MRTPHPKKSDKNCQYINMSAFIFFSNLIYVKRLNEFSRRSFSKTKANEYNFL